MRPIICRNDLAILSVTNDSLSADDLGGVDKGDSQAGQVLIQGGFWGGWRDLHEHFGKWSSVYHQFRRWTLPGLWELLLEAYNDSGGGNPSLQMTDSTIFEAQYCSAGAKGKRRARVLAAQKAALRPISISASMRWACP